MAIIHVLGSSIFFYVFLLIIPTTISISESEALLKLKQSFANATALDSWNPGTEPCANGTQWIGVLCYNGSVMGLRLGHLGLSGTIDVDALVSLPGLRSIAFMSNAFSGPIPEFHRMGLLKGLYLSGNRFSGEIPSDYFTRIEGLKKVWLSGNMLSGQIPSSLARLSHLMELHLEDNRFSGHVPVLEQPSLVSLNLSNNNLEGEIPLGLSKFGPHGFRENPGLCGGNLGKGCALQNNTPYQKIVTWVLVASALVFLLMILGIYVLKRRQERLNLMVGDSHSFRESSVGKRISKLAKKGSGRSTGVGRAARGQRNSGKGLGI